MKQWVPLALFLAVVLGPQAHATAFTNGAVAGNCTQDDEIGSSLRVAIDDAAMSFATALLGPTPDAAYPMMTTEAHATVTREGLSANVGSAIGGLRPFAPPHISHTYFVQSIGFGPNTRAMCGLLTNNAWVSVEIKPGQSEAHVVITTATRNNDWALTLRLLQEDGQWRVQYFHINASSLVGLSPETLLAQARRERDEGHAFNAAMLYVATRSISERGPSFQLAIEQSLSEDSETFRMPAELSGNPPFRWQLQGTSYDVGGVQVVGVDGHLGLIFLLPRSTWPSDHDADLGNRTFINAFVAAHPDYSRAFHFLVARALRPDGAGGFGTVYEDGTGFH